MKSLQYYVGLLQQVYVGGPENRPRVRVYLNGLNDFANGFQSYSLPPFRTVGGDIIPLTNSNFDYQLQPVKGTPVLPAAGIPQGLATLFQYITNFGGLGQAGAVVVPQGFTRSLYQTMQQIAIHKPFVKYIKIQLYNYIVAGANLQESLGNLYIGKMGDPLVGDKPDSDIIELKQYYKPNAFNSGFNSPQDYLANINNFSSNLRYIELDIPINRVIDADTLLAIDAPVDTYVQVGQYVTLYF